MVFLENCSVCQNSPKVDYFDDKKICISCCSLKVTGSIGGNSLFEEWNEKNKARTPISIKEPSKVVEIKKVISDTVPSSGKAFVKQRTTRR